MEQHQPITLRNLYPHFTDNQLEQAEANLERYLAVMMRIVERLRSEGYDWAAPDLTRSQTNASIPDVKVE
jgi:hypothetical protein